MESNVKNTSKKSAISITLFIVAIVIAILGVALLVVNIYLYKTSVTQAVAQGYAIATVRKALISSQLLPGIFQPIGIYGGIALLLLGVSKISDKVSRCLVVLNKTEINDDSTQENCVDQVDQVEQVEQDVENTEKIETTNTAEISDETEKK